MIDQARRYDLEQLVELVRKSKSAYERDHWEGIIRKIMNETSQVRELREELIDSIRAGDRRHVRYVQERLRVLRYNETGGKDL